MSASALSGHGKGYSPWKVNNNFRPSQQIRFSRTGKSPLQEIGLRAIQPRTLIRNKKSLTMTLPALTLYLAAPRGFCAGVDRAVKIVELAIQKWGAPVYVRHEIVHNKYVVDGLRDLGAVFVESLADCPDDRPVVFSAHGVAKSVPAEATRRNMVYVDATCPLVSKVHIEAQRHSDNNLQMVMIGHAGHPETVGTMGQLPAGEVLLVETADDVALLTVRDPEKLAFITQTTLSVDDTAAVVTALKARFPGIKGPHKEDICYATTNRQQAVKSIAPDIDALLVIGAPNSSNSQRLVEVGRAAGCAYAQLVRRATDIDWRALGGIKSVGITAGASAPEVLVDEVINAFRARFDLTVENVEVATENIEFKTPRILREPA
jgi:4-hydroxy-3-methylbut-2-enyl diphosphate reductase